MFFANAQEVALAARVGGLEASQTANLPTAAGAVPEYDHLGDRTSTRSSQIDWSHIRLEHNVTPSGSAVVLNSDSAGGFDVNPKSPLAAPPFTNTRYVRLTVSDTAGRTVSAGPVVFRRAALRRDQGVRTFDRVPLSN